MACFQFSICIFNPASYSLSFCQMILSFCVLSGSFLTLHLTSKQSRRIQEHMDYRNRQYNHIGFHELKRLRCKTTNMKKISVKLEGAVVSLEPAYMHSHKKLFCSDSVVWLKAPKLADQGDECAPFGLAEIRLSFLHLFFQGSEIQRWKLGIRWGFTWTWHNVKARTLLASLIITLEKGLVAEKSNTE